MKKIRTTTPFRMNCTEGGVVEFEFGDDEFDDFVQQIASMMRREKMGSVIWFDDERRLRTRISENGVERVVVIRGLKGKYLQIVEQLAKGAKSTDELYGKIWNRDEFQKEVPKNDVHVYICRLRGKLKQYGLTIGTDNCGKKFIKKL